MLGTGCWLLVANPELCSRDLCTLAKPAEGWIGFLIEDEYYKQNHSSHPSAGVIKVEESESKAQD